MVAIFWWYGIENLSIDLQFMTRRTLNVYWRLLWVILTPIFMIIIFIYYLVKLENPTHGKDEYPTIVLGKSTKSWFDLNTTLFEIFSLCRKVSGWCIFIVGVTCVPIFAAIRLFRSRKLGLYGAFKNGLQPNKMWGPKNPKLKTEWLRFKEDIQQHKELEVITQGHSKWKRILYVFIGKYQRKFVANHS